MLAGGVLVGDQPFGSGDEIVENILLVELAAGVVPFFAVLATTAEVGGGKDEALFEKGENEGAKFWSDGDVESAVSVEKSGILAV